jgi:CheY-like chemotaxis protein
MPRLWLEGLLSHTAEVETVSFLTSDIREMKKLDRMSIIVLLVEDDLNDLTLFQLALRRAGVECRLEIARDGQEAVEWLTQALRCEGDGRFPLPDVVISDLKMPRKDGWELFQWIRSQPQLQSLPFVLLTASGERRDKERARELGVITYFEKSIRAEEILTYLAELQPVTH